MNWIIRNLTFSTFIALTLIACSESSTAQKNADSSNQAKVASELSQEENLINNYEELEEAALTGDYQAQRNLAYTLTTKLPHNPILGCAWRIVIIESGSDQVDQSDTGNKNFDCDQKLSADEMVAAKQQARNLQEKIAQK